MIRARTRGFGELQGKLTALRSLARHRILHPAMSEAAEEMAERIRARAPERTGMLASRIYVSLAPVGPGDQVLNVRSPVGWIVIDVFYARYVEYGTSLAPPHPFVRPALDEGFETFLGTVAKLTWTAIVDVMRTGAGLATGAAQTFVIAA